MGGNQFCDANVRLFLLLDWHPLSLLFMMIDEWRMLSCQYNSMPTRVGYVGCSCSVVVIRTVVGCIIPQFPSHFSTNQHTPTKAQQQQQVNTMDCACDCYCVRSSIHFCSGKQDIVSQYELGCQHTHDYLVRLDDSLFRSMNDEHHRW